MVGALRRTRPTTGERAGRVPIGALQAAAQGSRARQSTVRELSIPMVRDRMATKKLVGEQGTERLEAKNQQIFLSVRPSKH